MILDFRGKKKLFAKAFRFLLGQEENERIVKCRRRISEYAPIIYGAGLSSYTPQFYSDNIERIN